MTEQSQAAVMIERILAHKVYSVIAGLIHLGLSLWLFIWMMSGVAITVFAALVCVTSSVFCLLLLIGIFMKKKTLMMVYLIYNILYILLIFILFILSLVYYPITVGWFFGIVFYILLLLLIFFVVFMYFATTNSTQSTETNDEV